VGIRLVSHERLLQPGASLLQQVKSRDDNALLLQQPRKRPQSMTSCSRGGCGEEA